MSVNSKPEPLSTRFSTHTKQQELVWRESALMAPRIVGRRTRSAAGSKQWRMGIVGRGADFEADLEIYAWNEAELVRVKSHRMT